MPLDSDDKNFDAAHELDSEAGARRVRSHRRRRAVLGRLPARQDRRTGRAMSVVNQSVSRDIQWRICDQVWEHIKHQSVIEPSVAVLIAGDVWEQVQEQTMEVCSHVTRAVDNA